MKMFYTVVGLFALAACVGCSGFERNTFNTLASAQAVLNTAQADYESGAIPQNKCSYSLITNAKTADSVAVQAMVVYEQEKAAGANLAAQEAAVAADLAPLATLVAQVEALKSTPLSCPS